jgi:hypothetical protein
MDSIEKIYAVNAEALSASNNIVQFDIPAGSMYDFSKSAVMLNMRLTTSHADANVTDAICSFPVAINIGNNDFASYLKTSALIKNAHLDSQAVGRVEELRDVALLRNTLAQMNESENQVMGGEMMNSMAVRAFQPYGSISPLIEATARSGETSRYVDKLVKIPFSDILNVGKVQMFDTARLGTCRLHLEVNMDKIAVEPATMLETYFTTQKNGQVVDNAVAGAVTEVVLGVGAVSKKYDESFESDLPYYIGQPLEVASGTLDGADISGTLRKINDITQAADGSVTLTLNASLGTIAGAGTVNVIFKPAVDNFTASIEVSQPELRLYSVGSANMPAQRPDKIEFTKYTLERDFGSGQNNFKRQYVVPAEAINAVVCMKNQTDGLLSNLAFENARVAIDNENTTDRDVVPFTPLYYNRLDAHGLNSGQPVKSVMGKSFKRIATDNNRGLNKDIRVIVESLPVTNREKLVEYDIESAAGVQEVNFYYEAVASV